MKNIEDVYELSPVQQGMLFHSLLAPDSGVYVQQMACTFLGQLNVAAFQQAWQQVLDRHTILRTSFVWDDLDKPLQIVHRRIKVPLRSLDWRGLAPDQQKEQLAIELDAARSRGFVPSKAPLMQLTLIQAAAETFHFAFTCHHLLLDGWSIPLVLSEVFAGYEAFCRGQSAQLGRSYPYGDYIAWLQQQDLAAAETFWRRKLKGFTAPTPLAVDRAAHRRPGQQNNDGEHHIALPQHTTQALHALAQRHRLTMNTLAQGAWAVLLSRYSGEQDVVFGTTVSGRPAALAGVEAMIGLFINTLPVRAHVPAGALLLAWLKELQTQQIEARQYEYSPLIQIQGWSEVPRDQPLFESLLVFENYPMDDSAWRQSASLEIRPIRAVEQTHYPLTAGVAEQAGMLSAALLYDTARFDSATIRRMLNHYQALLDAMATDPEQPLRALALLTAAERQQLLVEWNSLGDRGQGTGDRTIQGLFAEQAARTPDAVAVVFDSISDLMTKDERRRTNDEGPASRVRGSGVRDQDGVQPAPDPRSLTPDPWYLTYAELNARANQLAHHLRAMGVGSEVRVGICMERSLDMLIGLLGVLKAGGAYVPLDPAYPAERISFMLEDSGATVLITTNDIRCPEGAQTNDERMLPSFVLRPSSFVNLEVIDLRSDWPTIARQPACEPEGGATYANLAYVIYTSGSTGAPKGVLVTHGALLNYIVIVGDRFGIRSDDRILQFASISFDTAAEEIYPCLARGATLVLRSEALVGSVPAFLRACHDLGLTIVDLPTAYWHELAAELADGDCRLPGTLRLVLIGGEQALPERIAQWQQRVGDQVRLMNGYGPTEATIVTTFWELPVAAGVPGDAVPIGRPLPNARVYILDAHGAPAPIGVPGELYIGGAGVARGYLDRPELTAALFIPNPFARVSGVGYRVSEDAAPNTWHPIPDTRLYKTGDLARYLANGEIEFLGRIDNQVKLRGYRIELGEIEAALRSHAEVRDAAVVACEERLVAYVVEGLGVRSQGSGVPGLPADDEGRRTKDERPASQDRRLKIEDSDADTSAPLSSILYPLSSELRDFLATRLPAYMLPTAFVALDALPLTPNGKLDLRALPAPEWAGAHEAYLAPRDALELQLTHLWEDVLGTRPIGVTDNFFTLGGHSLLAVRLMLRVRKQFGPDLPLSLLFQRPTVEQMAGALRQSSGSLPWSPLVSIQPDGARPPFFCVHPAGGHVLCYVGLAHHLGRDQPFYGLQAFGHEEDQEPYTTVEAMAAVYAQAMRSVQPQGPYYLGGLSMGSVVAFEMAQQLHRQGETVALLVLMGTGAPTPEPEDEPADDGELIARLVGERTLPMPYDEFRHLDADAQMNVLLELARKARLVPLDAGSQDVRRFLQVFKANSRAMDEYVPRVYPDRMTLFLPEGPGEDAPELDSDVDLDDPTLGWAKLSTQLVEVYTVPGIHEMRMFSEPYVQILADRLRSCLDQAQYRRST